ncbi:MAG: hypothetical protein Q9163_000158 [Psora crenata]
MGSASDIFCHFLSSNTTPSLTPCTSFESEYEWHAPPPPVTLSVAMAQEPIDPADDRKEKEYTFAKLLTLIQKHDIYLRHPDDEAEEIGDTDVSKDLLRKDIATMTEEEILAELDELDEERKKGSSVQEYLTLPNPADRAEPWSVNHRRERLGHDPAVTINHLVGNGEIVYHYPTPVFNLLALQEDLRAYLISWLMVGVCGGREVEPYCYRKKDRLVRKRRKPLVGVMIALCNTRDPRVVETLEMARSALYTQNRFTFSHPKHLLRFLGSIGWVNVMRLSFKENIKVSTSFFTARKQYDVEMLWLRRWTHEMRYYLRGTRYTNAYSSQGWEKSPSCPDEVEQTQECGKLWRAIVAINEVLNDAEKMDDMLDVSRGINKDRRGKSGAEARRRIQTLDLGGRFADVAEQLKMIDLGRYNDGNNVLLPYPDNDMDFDLYAQKRPEWCDRWLENKRATEPDFDDPNILRYRTIDDATGLSTSPQRPGTWYLDSVSAAKNLGLPFRYSWEELSEPAEEVNDDAWVEQEPRNHWKINEQTEERSALRKQDSPSTGVDSVFEPGFGKAAQDIITSKKRKKVGKDIHSVGALKKIGML